MRHFCPAIESMHAWSFRSAQSCVFDIEKKNTMMIVITELIVALLYTQKSSHSIKGVDICLKCLQKKEL